MNPYETSKNGEITLNMRSDKPRNVPPEGASDMQKPEEQEKHMGGMNLDIEYPVPETPTPEAEPVKAEGNNGRKFDSIFMFLHTAALISTFALFLLFTVLGTCSLIEYRSAISAVINWQKSTIQEKKENTANQANLATPVSAQNTDENAAPVSQEEALSEAVRILNLIDEKTASMEVQSSSFKITANNAIVIIIFQYLIAMGNLILLFRYLNITIKKKMKK